MDRAAIRLGFSTALLGLSAAVAGVILLQPAPRPATASPLPAQVGVGEVVDGWAQVLTATPRWLVLQNQQGQQFPVSFDDIGLFVIRWPTTPERLTGSSLVEVTGVSPNASEVVTSRVDVYEGGARSLVAPGVLLIAPNGQVSRPIDFLFNPEVYGAPFPGLDAPIHSGIASGPQLTHVVGPIANQSPLQIAIGGNKLLTVIPADAAYQMTQITPGSPALIKPGDLVYYVAARATPLSLELNRLVINKAMFIDQFAP